MSKQNYDAKLGTIEAIDLEDVKSPNMPVHTYLQEAEDLHIIAQEDKQALVGAGLNWAAFGNDLPVRAGALRYAQSLWNKDRFTQEEAQQAWSQQSPETYNLRDQLLHTFRFAYRKNEDLLSKVSSIGEGTGHADMIQDLSDLAAFGKEHLQELTAIKFDKALLTTAATQADEMAVVLARANGEKGDSSAARITRDKAYTHLKEAVDEIRTTGKYVFWKNDQKLRGYISSYIKRRNSA